MHDFDLAGKTAVITGGAKGLGAAIARRFAQSGARIAIWDLETDAATATAALPEGTESLALHVDVSDPASVAAATKATLAEFGGIDILVNSAGIAGPVETVWDYPSEDWGRVIEVNLLGVFHCCKAVVPAMRAAGYGRIVNIASVAGKEGNPKSSAYSASKAGVIALTKSLGKEVLADGVIVNAVAPAAFETDMVAGTKGELRDYMISKIPLGRMGQPDEIGSLVAWMASAECSFSTGAVFDISGGRATY